jgi:hypothetical protein
LDAMADWFDRYGRLPSWNDWSRADPSHPTAKTVHRKWGWPDARAAALDLVVADLEDVAGHHGRYWTSDRILQALISDRVQEGRWPTGPEWEAGSETHPSRRHVMRVFGSWDQAIAAATTMYSRHRRASRSRATAVPGDAHLRPR